MKLVAGQMELSAGHMEITTKIDDQTRELQRALEAEFSRLNRELDKLTNRCPRLLFVREIQLGRVKGKMKEGYELTMACESCYSIVHRYTFQQDRKWLRSAKKILSTASKVVAVSIPQLGTLSRHLASNPGLESLAKRGRELEHLKEWVEATETVLSKLAREREVESEEVTEVLSADSLETCELLAELDAKLDTDKSWRAHFHKQRSADGRTRIWVGNSCCEKDRFSAN